MNSFDIFLQIEDLLPTYLFDSEDFLENPNVVNYDDEEDT